MTSLVVHVIRRIPCSPAYRFSGQWGPISRHITHSRSQTAIDCVKDDPILRSERSNYKYFAYMVVFLFWVRTKEGGTLTATLLSIATELCLNAGRLFK